VKNLVLLFILMISLVVLHGQSFVSEHIMSVDSNYMPSIDYSVKDVAWISGYWVGEGLGGHVEELWSNPRNGKMICAFRYDNGEEMIFSEHVTMTNTDKGISMLVKHFSADFSAWEEKEEYVEFPIIKIDGQTAYFNGCTFVREGDHLNIYVLIGEDGSSKEELFSYDLSEL